MRKRKFACSVDIDTIKLENLLRAERALLIIVKDIART